MVARNASAHGARVFRSGLPQDDNRGSYVGKHAKVRERILAGSADSNIEFSELCNLLCRLGFIERIRGDHHIFTRDAVPEIVNLQPAGKKAKPYQVKQVRSILVKYRLGEMDVD